MGVRDCNGRHQEGWHSHVRPPLATNRGAATPQASRKDTACHHSPAAPPHPSSLERSSLLLAST